MLLLLSTQEKQRKLCSQVGDLGFGFTILHKCYQMLLTSYADVSSCWQNKLHVGISFQMPYLKLSAQPAQNKPLSHSCECTFLIRCIFWKPFKVSLHSSSLLHLGRIKLPNHQAAGLPTNIFSYGSLSFVIFNLQNYYSHPKPTSCFFEYIFARQL